MQQNSYKMNILITCPRTEISLEEFINFFNSNNIQYDFNFPSGQGFTSDELSKIYREQDVLIVGDDQVDSTFINEAKSLKHIIKWGKGIDSIDQEACKNNRITLTNSPGNISKYVSEHALALTLSLLKKVKQNISNINEGKWYKETSDTLFDKTIGFFGFGAIGYEISKLLKPYNVKIIYYDVRDFENLYELVSLNDLFKKSDILFITAELNKETKYVVDLKYFELMKNSSYLINVSRGQIINESDLIFALENNYLSGVGLDVLDVEPIDAKNRLKNFENVLITCHNASNTVEASKDVNLMILDKLREIL